MPWPGWTPNGRRLEEASATHQQAPPLFTELGDRHREEMALDGLGRALLQSGRLVV